jgi:putative endonuclease
LSSRSEAEGSAFLHPPTSNEFQPNATIDFTVHREYNFYVYILSSRSRNLYVGMTNNIRKRVFEHRQETPASFTAHYKINRLVYFERYQYVNNAIAREKELKDWNRARKIALIESENPTWEDLAADW